MPFYLKLEGVTGDVTDNYIFDGDGKDDLATYQPDPDPAGQPITFTASVDGSIYSFDGDGFDLIDTSVDAGETTVSGVGIGRTYTFAGWAHFESDDLDLAASTADADVSIDEAFTFDGNQISHHGSYVPTGTFQAMLDQQNDFDGDGKDDLATYQPTWTPRRPEVSTVICPSRSTPGAWEKRRRPMAASVCLVHRMRSSRAISSWSKGRLDTLG